MIVCFSLCYPVNPEYRSKLKDRVVSAAEAALAAQDYVSAIDILTEIGWLAPAHLDQWRTGRLPCLEAAIQTKPSNLLGALRLLRAWASERGLAATEATYHARTPARTELRFSTSGNPTLERAYRTHWVSPKLSEKRRRRLEERMKPPELVVIEPISSGWKCHRCGRTGPFLIMEPPGPACLRCAQLDTLEFLPSGDARLSRLAKAKSPVHAVVVRFSRSRRRYERQGLLVEPEALREAERELRRPHP